MGCVNSHDKHTKNPSSPQKGRTKPSPRKQDQLDKRSRSRSKSRSQHTIPPQLEQNNPSHLIQSRGKQEDDISRSYLLEKYNIKVKDSVNKVLTVNSYNYQTLLSNNPQALQTN